ncbi:hypothetical protein YC2023_067334 [Brassica napus]
MLVSSSIPRGEMKAIRPIFLISFCSSFKHTFKGLTGSNAAVVVAEVCGCGRLRFLAVLRDLYDWYCG